MDRKQIRGRFAPSPSGRLHLGNMLSSLLAWLDVRSLGGTMVFRLEDLDPERSYMDYAALMAEDLEWLGLDWDEEMPLQSARGGIYQSYFDKLSTYPCYCSRSELHAASAPHASDGKWIYAGTCRDLTPEERAAKGRAPAWRVRVPEETVCFTDGVFGEYGENLATDCGDFILRRSDGVFAYQLAVVCDDALGGVTEVVRGCDLLSSTPRQLWLYRQLGFSAPRFFHVPLLVAADGKRLSKRERSLDMAHLRQRCRPEEILGELAFAAGITAKNEPVSARELVPLFSFDRLPRENIHLTADFCDFL